MQRIWFHGCPRKISTRMSRNIVRLVKNKPRISREHLQEHLANEGVDVSLNSVQYFTRSRVTWTDALGRHRW